MFYEIEGKTKVMTVGEIDAVIAFAIDYLGIEDDIDLTVNFDRSMIGGKTAGYADEVDAEEGMFEIAVKPDLPRQEMIATILHEMVHVHQMARGDLIQGMPSIWKGEPHDGQYMELPWEIEAYAIESAMVARFCHCG